MSYSFSTGQTGSQSVLSIGSTPVVIGQIQDIAFSGQVLKMLDSTNLQSVVEEEQPSLPNAGELKVTCLRVPTDTGQAAVQTAFNLGSQQTAAPFTLQLAPNAADGQTTHGDKFAFNAYVTSYIPSASVSAEKLILSEFVLKVVTPYTMTPGT
jgi:hypothetical protein